MRTIAAYLRLRPEALPQQVRSSYTASYSLYLGILLWASLPYGSYSVFYELLLASLIMLCSLVWLGEALYRREDVLAQVGKYWLPLALLTLVLGWLGVQTLTLDVVRLDSVAPLNAAVYRSLGQPQGSISVAPSSTAVSGFSTAGLLLFFVLSLLLHRSDRRIRLTLLVIVFCGTCQALYGSFMTLSGLEYGYDGKKQLFLGVATGTFGGRNQLAGYLEMCLACGIGLLIANLDKEAPPRWRDRLRRGLDTMLGPKMRLRVCLALMVIALVLTRSRMGNTAFFAALAVCGLLYMLLRRQFNRGTLILFASLMLVDFLIVGQWFGFERLAERIEATSLVQEDRDEQVLDVWNMFKASPWTGVGLGTYFVIAPYFMDRTQQYYDHPHNDYLEFAAELGIVGLVPLAVLVLASLWMAVSAMRLRRRRIARGAGFAATMGILSLLIHAWVDFNLQVPANALLFVFLLALAWMARYQRWDGATA